MGGVRRRVTTESYQLGSRNRYAPQLSRLPTLTVWRSVPDGRVRDHPVGAHRRVQARRARRAAVTARRGRRADHGDADAAQRGLQRRVAGRTGSRPGTPECSSAAATCRTWRRGCRTMELHLRSGLHRDLAKGERPFAPTFVLRRSGAFDAGCDSVNPVGGVSCRDFSEVAVRRRVDDGHPERRPLPGRRVGGRDRHLEGRRALRGLPRRGRCSAQRRETESRADCESKSHISRSCNPHTFPLVR